MTTPPANHPRAAFGALLKRYRLERGMTQLAVGRRFKVTKDAVGTWERGRSIPDETAARGLDQLLQSGGEIYRAWLEADSTGDKATAAPVGLSPDSLLASSAQEASDFGSWAEIANTGAVAITTIDRRARALADLALTRPPAEIIAEAASINHALFEILRGHHKPAHARRLYRAAGATCALLAWLSGDLGSLDAASIHGATAQTCAEMAEDPELSGWAAVVQSKTAFWTGDFVKAANIAADGATAARGAPGTVQIMLACQRADAWARLRAAAEAATALDDAARAAEQQRGTDSLGGLFTCAPGRVLNYAAGSNNEIGRYAQAQAAADAALEVFGRDPAYGFGTVAQTHVTKTLAYANAGDLDAAAVAVRPVLELPAERRLSTVIDRLSPLARALVAPSLATSRVAAPLREEITEWCGGSGRRALGPGSGGRP